MQRDWKTRLYDAYVSSGQAGLTASESEASFEATPYIDFVIKRFVGPDRSVRVLDIGCGYGGFLHFLKRAGYADIQGVDISEEQIAVAHRRGVQEAQHGDAMAFLAMQPADSTDVVLVMDILEHMRRQELFDLLEAIARVLKPGGRIIGHVPNAEGLNGMAIRYGDLTHELSFTESSCRQIFKALGFAEVRCYEDRPIAHGVVSIVRRGLWALGTLPTRLLRAAETGRRSFILSSNMTFVAVK